MKSLSFYFTLFIIKLKGLKKNFSKDPIDYKKIRKEDVHDPKGKFFGSENVRSFTVSKTKVTEIKLNKTSSKLVLFVHGGAFICGPAKHHWDSIRTIAEQTNQTVWMCDYPKAPESGIQEISDNLDEVYNAALEKFEAKHISLIGDSVGGTLIAALTQRLIQKKIKVPNQVILVSPVMDATLSNPLIDKIDSSDPVLSKKGVLSAKRMCAGEVDLSNPMISPLNGSFDQFPKTVLYIAKNDITCPDQELTASKMNKAKIKLEVIEGDKMPHIWPFLPVMKEAKTALKQIIERLNA